MKLERLVYLTTARLPTEKAHGLQIMKMCEAFADCGIDVTLVYPRRRQPPELASADDPFAFYGIRRVFTATKAACVDASWVKRFSERLWFGMVDATATTSALLAGRRQAAGRWRDVVFYSRDPWMVRAGLRFRRNLPGRWVFEAHRPPSSPRVARRLGRSDAVIVVTEGLRKAYIDNGVPAHRVHVAPDGVDLETFTVDRDRKSCRETLGLPVGRAIVGYVGRFQTMGEEKGISELVVAMGDPRLRDVCLVCVGGPLDAVSRYHELARSRSIDRSRLLFFDRIPHREVPVWIRAFDVAAMPFPDTPHYARSMSPLKLFEYMAVGATIVATDLPSVREVLHHGDNAWLVAPGSAEALASGLSHLLTHRDEAERLGTRARAGAGAYTWKLRAAAILIAIESSNKDDESPE